MRAGWWAKIIVLGSLAAWALVGIGTAAFALGGQAAPRAFANACLAVAGLFALGALFRFGGTFLRHSRVMKLRDPIPPSAEPFPLKGDARGRPQVSVTQGPASPRTARYAITGPPKDDTATLAFAVLATLVMVQVLVLGFMVGNKA